MFDLQIHLGARGSAAGDFLGFLKPDPGAVQVQLELHELALQFVIFEVGENIALLDLGTAVGVDAANAAIGAEEQIDFLNGCDAPGELHFTNNFASLNLIGGLGGHDRRG